MKPILKKILEPSPWWGPYNPLTGFAYNFKTNQYMSRGYTIPIGTAVTEGRTTDAYVLDADGTYELRSANEPAQANGHGLDGFDGITNLFANPEITSNTGWVGGGQGSMVVTPNQGPAPDGALTSSKMTSVFPFTFGTQMFQTEAIINTKMTLSIWASTVSGETADIRLFMNDFEFRLDETITDTIQRFDLTGTIGGTLFGSGRCGFNNMDDWSTKSVFVAWAQLVVGDAVPFAVGTRDADDTRVAQGDDGGSPTIAPGFTANPDEITFRVDWNDIPISTGADRVLFQAKNASNRFVSLLIDSSDDLRWGGDQTGSFQSLDAGGTFDDGGAHTAVCYFNRTTSEFKLSVDGAAAITGTLTGAVPSNLDEMAISRTATGTSNNVNGVDCRLQAADCDFFENWKESSAGFF